MHDYTFAICSEYKIHKSQINNNQSNILSALMQFLPIFMGGKNNDKMSQISNLLSSFNGGNANIQSLMELFSKTEKKGTPQKETKKSDTPIIDMSDYEEVE